MQLFTLQDWRTVKPVTEPGQAWQQLPRGDLKLRKGLVANAGTPEPN